MAKAKEAAGKVKARVLMDGIYGKCNSVVELDAAEVKAGELAGELDSNAEAVKAAESN